jgi:hypothetical protein
MAKVPLSDVNSRYGSVGALNANFDSIEQGFNNTLSRDGTGPNQMEAPLDMNGNPILNVSTVNAGSLILGGTTIEPGTAIAAATVQVFEFTATAGQTSFSIAPLTPTSAGTIVEVNGVTLPVSAISITGSTLLLPAMQLNDEVVVRVFTRQVGAATAANSADVAFVQAGAGAVTRTVQGKLRDVVSVLDFGADPTGNTDSTTATAAAIAAVRAAGGGAVFFPQGTYLLNGAAGADGTLNGILIPYTGPNGTGSRVRLVGAGRSTLLRAGSNSMNIIRASDSHCVVEHLTLDGNGRTGVTALAVVPESLSQTTSVVYQLYNVFQHLYILSCAEGITLRTGPDVAGIDSGCWYNAFKNMHIYSCTRGIWLRDCPVGSSGNNRNYFQQIRVGQNCNTGLQIDDGDTNVFAQVHVEGITSGTSPNATPTGIRIKQTGGSGLDNNDNRFFGCVLEAVTRSIENANASTELHGCTLSSPNSAVWTATPRVLLGGDASQTPQWSPGLFLQAGSQVAGFADNRVYATASGGFGVEQTGSYSFKGDEDTGLRRVAADVGGLFAGGNTQLDFGGRSLRNYAQTEGTGPGGSPSTFSFARAYAAGGLYLVARGATDSVGTSYSHRVSIFAETTSGTFIESTRILDSQAGSVTVTTDTVTRSGSNFQANIQINKAATSFTNYASVLRLA